ncbi:MAG: Maf family protein [Proteobacteria bacterium]|jgi:septum formation protein|nr:Maf family protein [Pseudomonadota bacterium]MDA0971878.1 Maf family protein [Pseudomonadota bacterium]
MSKITKGLVLASASSRRLELLNKINIVPEIIQAANIDETPKKKEKPIEYCKRLAREKGDFVFQNYPDMTVLSADTIVFCSNKIFGKASSDEEARSFLNFFSGRKHSVLTAIYLRNKNLSKIKYSISKVTFIRLEKKDIDIYLATREWENKAGAYAIQGYAERFVKTINGSYSNIVGLPLQQAFNLLKTSNLI